MISVTSPFRSRVRPLARTLAALCGALTLLPLGTQAEAPSIQPLRVLIVGGGPDLANNQVAIESNVRYVCKLLPRGSERTTLFADGDTNHATVLYEEDSRTLPVGERLLRLLMEGRDAGDENPQHYRKPNVGGKLDGPANRAEIGKSFDYLLRDLSEKPRPLLLYFTGHGSPGRGGFENNVMDLWGEKERISVREVAEQIKRLPETTPITLVMVQCYSGAFANLLFEGGDPEGEPSERDIAGFFAAVKERVAAGCTSALNEAEYHDFTSYFFAALAGRDRVGRRITGVDYNGDARIGMDEAFCYTLAHDKSIDVPVCTSDVYLRRFVPLKDADLFQTPYRDVISWASPAQRYALETLSKTLIREGEARLQKAYEEMRIGPKQDGAAEYRSANSRYSSLRREGRRFLNQRWPDLKDPKAESYKRVRQEAISFLARNAAEPEWKDLIEADDTLFKLQAENEAREVAWARLLRFVRLGKSVILSHALRESSDTKRKARFEKLVEAESRSLLPHAEKLKGRGQG
jgi:hypothetical protein